MNFELKGLRADAMLFQLLLGALGGSLAWFAGMPMPFLVGGLLATAAAAIRADGKGLFAQRFPQPVRRYFTAIIGVMIGQSFTPDLLQGLSAYWITLTGVALFVLVAQLVGYGIFRIIGGYDPRTAYFAAMPGGLIEAITFSEQFGADVRAITVQHFARIILVVIVVPFMFLVWTGVSVGSSGGVTLDSEAARLADVLWTLLIAVAGFLLARAIHLPAGVLIGPLLLSAFLQGSGLISSAGPTWLLYSAQLVVGVGLGSSFAGITRSLLVRAFLLCSLSVSVFLCIGVGFALSLHKLTGLDLPALIISFVPGGVTEMSLIALSLNLSPLVVAMHHVFRILSAVFMATIAVRFMKDQP